MSKTKSTATKAKATKGAPQIKKDGKGRFWVVPKDGSAEQGPFETNQAALAAKAGDPAPKAEKAAKAAKPKKAKEPKEKRVSAIDAAAQVLSASKEPMNAKEMIEAMAAKKLWTSPGGATPHATLYTVVTMLPNLAP
jgi:HB1, ASXL, restriction endonuclease HTH domain